MDGEGPPRAPAPRLRIDALSTVIFALMLAGAGALLVIAQINVGNDSAAITYGNVGWWLVAEAGLLLMVEAMLRLVLPRFQSSPLRLVVSVLLLAVGVGGLSHADFIIPIGLIGLGIASLVAQLVMMGPPAPHSPSADEAARRPLFDSLSGITFSLGLIGVGVLLLAVQAGDAEGALIHAGNLDLWIGGLVEGLLLLEILVRVAFARYRSYISARLAVFFLILALGVGIKFDMGWTLPALLIGAAVVLLVARFGRV